MLESRVDSKSRHLPLQHRVLHVIERLGGLFLLCLDQRHDMMQLRKALRRHVACGQDAVRCFCDVLCGFLHVSIQVQSDDSHREAGVEPEVLAGFEPFGTQGVQVRI